jgi:hypothetical protein
MARLTGKDGTISLNIAAAGAVVVGNMKEWEYNETGSKAETTGSGDDWVAREPVRKDWTVDFRAGLEVDDPYVLPSTLVNQSVAVVLRLIDSDTNGLISLTGLGEELTVTVTAEGEEPVEITGQIVCSGTGPTWDLAPAA